MIHDDAPPPASDDGFKYADNPASPLEETIEIRSSFGVLPHDRVVHSETDRLRRLAAHLLSSEHDREDLVQDVWLQALERPPKERGKLSAWLQVVTHHAAQRLGRRQRNRKARERLVAKSEQLPSVLEALERDSVRREMLGWVESLKQPYREVVRLHYFQDCTIREISERLLRPETTVRSQLKRGLDQLRARYDGAKSVTAPARRKGFRLWIPWLAPVEKRASDLSRRPTTLFRLAAVAGGLFVATVIWLGLAGGSSSEERALVSAPKAADPIATVGAASLDVAPKEPRTAALSLDRAGAASSTNAVGVGASVESVVPPEPRRFAIEGRTVDVLGEIVPHAEIWISTGPELSEARLAARSDSEGRFVVPELAGDLWIHAEELDNGLTKGLRVPDPGTGQPAHLDLMFEANQGRLKGVVLDPSGNPVAGATVRACLQREGRTIIGGRGEERVNKLGAPRTTDEQGRFEITRIQAQGLTVLATAPGFCPYARAIEMTCTECLSIQLPPPTVVEMRVRWPDGSPAQGMPVSLELRSPLPGSTAVSDADGTVRFTTVPPGAFTLVGGGAKDGKCLSLLQRGTSLAGGTVNLGSIALSGSWTVGGSAQDRSGPLANWTVTLEEESSPRGGPPLRIARTSSDGRFGFPGCSGESYTLRLYRPEVSSGAPHARISQVRPGGPDVVLAVSEGQEPSAFVRGTLVDAGGDGRMSASIVRAISAQAPKDRDDAVETAVDRASGRFTLGPLPPGTYRLKVVDPALGAWRIGEVKLDPEEEVDLGEIAAPRAGSLRVTWSSLTGAEPTTFQFVLHGQGIELRGFRGFPGERAELDLDAHTLLIKDLLPGRYQFAFQGVDIARVSQEVQISEGSQTPLLIALTQGSPFLFRVLAPRPWEPGERVQIEIEAPTGIERFQVDEQNLEDIDGPSVRFRRVLTAGKHRVRAWTESGLTGELELEAPGKGKLERRSIHLK